MDTNQKINGLLDLQKIRFEKFKQTRELEFKVNIALWTLIVLVGYYFKGKLHLNDPREIIIYVLISIAIIVCHYFLWLNPISKSEERDFEKVIAYQERIEELVEESNLGSKGARTSNELRRDYRNWNLFLAGITFLLLCILGLFFSI